MKGRRSQCHVVSLEAPLPVPREHIPHVPMMPDSSLATICPSLPIRFFMARCSEARIGHRKQDLACARESITHAHAMAGIARA